MYVKGDLLKNKDVDAPVILAPCTADNDIGFDVQIKE